MSFWSGFKKVSLVILKGVAVAVSGGLIGRGKKTQRAGEIAEDVIDELNKSGSEKGSTE